MFKNVSKEMQNSKLTHIIKKSPFNKSFESMYNKRQNRILKKCFEL
jgi:hypothetical protein